MLVNRFLSKIGIAKNLNSLNFDNVSQYALVTRFPRDGAQFFDVLSSELDGFDIKAVAGFCLEGGQYWSGSPYSLADGYISFFQFPFSGVSDAVFVDHRIRFLKSSWSLAVLSRIIDMVRPGGFLFLPYHAYKLIEGLASETSDIFYIANVKYICVTGMSKPQSASSVVDWYTSRGNSLVLDEAIDIKPSSIQANAFLDCLVDGANESSSIVRNISSEIHGSGRSIGLVDVDEKMQEACVAHNYLINGISYKAPVILKILVDQFGGRQNLRGLDLGGGCGALGAELLMSNSQLGHIHTHDIAPQNITLSRDIYFYFNAQLRDKFTFSLGKIEEFKFKEQYDFICLVGSLLYVEKSMLETTLERIWSSIRSGGILIVHENIKRKDYSVDYDHMFTVSQIDGLLSKFANISFYSSHAPVKMDANEVEEKTVFRVVAKV